MPTATLARSLLAPRARCSRASSLQQLLLFPAPGLVVPLRPPRLVRQPCSPFYRCCSPSLLPPCLARRVPHPRPARDPAPCSTPAPAHAWPRAACCCVLHPASYAATTTIVAHCCRAAPPPPLLAVTTPTSSPLCLPLPWLHPPMAIEPATLLLAMLSWLRRPNLAAASLCHTRGHLWRSASSQRHLLGPHAGRAPAALHHP